MAEGLPLPILSVPIPQLTITPLPKLNITPLPVIPIPIDFSPTEVGQIIVKSVQTRPKKLVLDRIPIKNVNITSSLPFREFLPSDKIVVSQGLIKLPYNKTIITPPEVLPLKINTDKSMLALAYNPKQTILDVLDEIDENKLVSGRSSGAGSTVYTLDELKNIARKLGLKTSASKDTLITAIKQIINDRRSSKV